MVYIRYSPAHRRLSSNLSSYTLRVSQPGTTAQTAVMTTGRNVSGSVQSREITTSTGRPGNGSAGRRGVQVAKKSEIWSPAMGIRFAPGPTVQQRQLSLYAMENPDREVPEPVDPFIPPKNSLSFNIDPELFQAAKDAPEGSEQSYWSYSLYRGPIDESTGAPQKVSVHYCRSQKTMERVLSNHFMDEPVIGLDLEWVAESSRFDGLRKNVSLIQISSPSRIALFHVALFPEPDNKLVSPSLIKILQDDNVVKCGVCIKSDCTRLKTFMGLETRGIIELSNLYKVVKYSETEEYELINKRVVRLADQVYEYLKLPLFKGEVRTGNWSAPLTMAQIIYSASDAYAGTQLYQIYEDKRLSLDPVPPRPHFAELGLPIPKVSRTSAKKPKRKTAVAGTKTIITTVTEAVEEGEVVEEEEAEEELVEAISHIQITSKEAKKVTKTVEIQDPFGEDNSDRPIREDSDKTLEILSRFFDVEKLALAMKDTICDEDPDPVVAPFAEDERSSLMAEANEYAKTFQEEHANDEKIPLPQKLRAFYLWYEKDLTPIQIANIMRQPPLGLGTVASYVMDVIRNGKNNYDSDRMCQELVPKLSSWHKHMRYKGIIPGHLLHEKSSFKKNTLGNILRSHLEAAVAAFPDQKVQEFTSAEDSLEVGPNKVKRVKKGPMAPEVPVEVVVQQVQKGSLKPLTMVRSRTYNSGTTYDDFAKVVEEKPVPAAPEMGNEELEWVSEINKSVNAGYPTEEIEQLLMDGTTQLHSPEFMEAPVGTDEQTGSNGQTNTEEEIEWYPPPRPME